MSEIIEKIESLPDGKSMLYDTSTDSDYYPSDKVAGFTTDDLKHLSATVKSQAEVIRELREALEHYADESFWDDPHPEIGVAGTLYAFEDEFDGAIPGHKIAQAVLNKFKAAEVLERCKGEM